MRAFLRASPRALAAATIFLAAGAVLAAAQPNSEKKSPGAERGVLVAGVQPGSPAEKAGIARGDIILEAAGAAVDTPEQLKSALEAKKPGDSVGLKVRHGDAVRTVKVELADREGGAFLGVFPAPATAGRGPGPGPGAGPGPGKGPKAERPGEQFTWPWEAEQGARVTGVTPAGPAAQAGLAKDDLVLSVDGQKVSGGSSLSDLVAAKKPGDTVTLSVQSPGKEPRDVTVTLGTNADTAGAFLGVQYTAGPRMPWQGFPREFPKGFPWGNPREGGIGVMNGVLVAGVAEGGPAEKAGLKQNDLVTALDGVRVRSPQAVAETVASRKPGSTVTLTVVRMPDTKEMTLEVTLGENPSEKGKGYLGISMSRFMGFQGPERPDSDSSPTPWGGPRGRQLDRPPAAVPPGI